MIEPQAAFGVEGPGIKAGLVRERTVTGVTPTVVAILELATPSAAINNTLARFTSRWAAVEDLASTVNDSR